MEHGFGNEEPKIQRGNFSYKFKTEAASIFVIYFLFSADAYRFNIALARA